MPKESVYGSVLPLDESIPAHEYEMQQPIIEVRWGRYPESDVQIVTRRKGYEVAVQEPITCDYGLYVDLDRPAINDLIRKLRRARDQAFGRDE